MSELSFALELAELGGRLAAARFEAQAFTVESKPDGSPVTDVDRAAELLMRERIGHRHPDHAIVGEEFGGEADREWCWYLDPIDGTARFIADDPQWMTLVALADRGEVVLGVVSFPALGIHWWAERGQGAYRDGAAAHVSTRASLARARINDDWRGTLASGGGEHPLQRLAARAAAVHPHQGHSFLAVADGEADAAVNIDGYAWDYAPLQVIVEEAGGSFSDLRGDRSFTSRSAVVSNGLIHEEVLATLA